MAHSECSIHFQIKFRVLADRNPYHHCRNVEAKAQRCAGSLGSSRPSSYTSMCDLSLCFVQNGRNLHSYMDVVRRYISCVRLPRECRVQTGNGRAGEGTLGDYLP